MSAALNEIQKRLHKRISAEVEWQEIRVPSLLSKAGQAEFKKSREVLLEEYLDNCLLETHDMNVLLLALNYISSEAKIDTAGYVTRASNACRLSDELQDEVNAREFAEAEKRAKAAKSDKRQGEVDGQGKLFKDDGSISEEATPVSVVKMPTDIDRLAEEIEAMEVKLSIDIAVSEAYWAESGFKNTLPLAEQLAAYQSVWLKLRDMVIALEAPEPEPAVVNDGLVVVNEIDTFMNNEPLRITGPVLGDEDIVQAEVITDEFVDLTEEQSADLLIETIKKIDARRDELGISKDDLEQLYTDAAYDLGEDNLICIEKAQTVLRRLMAMKPVKKLKGSKKKDKKAPPAEEFTAAESEGSQIS